MILRLKRLLGLKQNEKTLGEETGNPIFSKKQGMNHYSYSKDGEVVRIRRGYDRGDRGSILTGVSFTN